MIIHVKNVSQKVWHLGWLMSLATRLLCLSTFLQCAWHLMNSLTPESSSSVSLWANEFQGLPGFDKDASHSQMSVCIPTKLCLYQTISIKLAVLKFFPRMCYVFIMSIFEMYWPAPLLCTMHVLFVCIDRKYNFNVKGYSARVEGIGLTHIILSIAFLYYILYTYYIFAKKGWRQVPQIACLKFCQKCDKKWYSVVRIQFGFLI